MLRRVFPSIFSTALAIAAILTTCCTASAIASDDDPAAPWHVGAAMRVIHPQIARHWRGARTQALVTTLWYPVDATIAETPREIGDPGHALFSGHPLAEHAPLSPARARYPLLVLSHGTGGSAASLDWLASALAAQGYIVAGVNHPGNNAPEPVTFDGFVLWWERATDLSEMLDGLLADPSFGAHIDRDRIGAVGFSLGGYTVLELAGARTDLQRFTNFCASSAADAICRPPEMDRLGSDAHVPADFSAATRASMARSGDSYRDPRIKAVFAMAPALGEAFDEHSFADVHIPVSLMAGSADRIAPVQTNIERIGTLLPAATVRMVPGAAHNTFLDTCLPEAVESAPMICKDGPGIDRNAVHAQAITQALTFFSATLPAPQ
jgi:predicted dienelactone hydrolase